MRATVWSLVGALVVGCTAPNDRLEPREGDGGGGGDAAVGGGGVDGAARRDGGAADAAEGRDAQGGGADACADCPAPECADGVREVRACGHNGRGEEGRTCAGGRWSAWGACDDPDECVLGAVDETACDEGGTRARRCEQGRWGRWSDCAVPPECDEGATEENACGPNGRGVQTRACAADGAWGPWGDCQGAGVCVDDRVETRACGPNGRGEETRTCVEGAWSAWSECAGAGVCVDGDVEGEACGPNGRGRRERRCVEGAWSAWSACAGAGVCVDGRVEVRPCGVRGDGEESRTCVDGAWTPWSDCAGAGECDEGDQQARGCGLNGRGAETRTCVDGFWSPWGECRDPDLCLDGAEEERPCGLNDRGLERRRCQQGQWSPWGDCHDPDVCRDGVRQDEPCGAGGRRERRCDEGRWSEWSACDEPADPCVEPDGTLRLDRPLVSAEVDSSGRIHRYGAGCGHGAGGAEAVLVIEVPEARLARFEVTDADFDTVLHLRRVCDEPDTELICDDDGGAAVLSRFEARLDAGRYFLLVDGFDFDEGGRATVTVASEVADCVDGARQQRPCGDGGTETRRCVGEIWTAWSECVTRCDPAAPACDRCTDRLEPSDARAAAPDIALGQWIGDLSLCGELDPHDYYAITIDQPGLVTASTERLPGTDIRGGGWTVSLEDAGGDRHGIAAVSPERTAQLALFPAAGTYFVHVDGDDLDGRLKYRLRVDLEPTRACEWAGPEGGCIPCRDGMDPNDDREAARHLPVGRRLAGLGVCTGLDPSDFFYFDVDRRREVRVQIDKHYELGRASLLWYDADGDLVTREGHGVGDRQWKTATVEPGRYYIEVRADPGVIGYVVSVTFR